MTNLALVDDHTMMRKTLATAFKLSNYSILFDAANGQEMIDKINQGPLPDLVVMDISMPVMNGFEATKWLTLHCPGVKVLALSVFNDEISIIRMLRNGAKGYITKDSLPEEMDRAVKEILEKGYYHSELISNKILQMVISNDKNSLVSVMENLTENEMTYLRLACTDVFACVGVPHQHIPHRSKIVIQVSFTHPRANADQALHMNGAVPPQRHIGLPVGKQAQQMPSQSY